MSEHDLAEEFPFSLSSFGVRHSRYSQGCSHKSIDLCFNRFRGDVNVFENVTDRKKERGTEKERSKIEKRVGKVIIHSSVHL